MKHTLNRIATPLTLGLVLCWGLPAAPAAADVEDIAASCAGCHGADGVSSDPHVPTIAGYSFQYTADSMLAYKEQERPCPTSKYRSGPKEGKETTMCEVADDLDEDEIDEIAEYFESKEFVAAEQKFDAALAEKGKAVHEEHCEKCHSDGGSLASDDAGILAGQWMPYLRQTFAEFSSGERPMTKKMKAKYESLDEKDIEALVNYYGSLK